MGLHFSRLALAVALAMQLAAPLHAAEQLDEFYIEIKGPDRPRFRLWFRLAVNR